MLSVLFPSALVYYVCQCHGCLGVKTRLRVTAGKQGVVSFCIPNYNGLVRAALNRRLRQCCGCSSSSCNRRLGSSIIIIITTTTTTSENCESNEQWNTSCVLVCIENDRADRLAGKVNIATGLRLGRSEVLRSSRHYLQAQRQGHHAIDRLEENTKYENVIQK